MDLQDQNLSEMWNSWLHGTNLLCHHRNTFHGKILMIHTALFCLSEFLQTRKFWTVVYIYIYKDVQLNIVVPVLPPLFLPRGLSSSTAAFNKLSAKERGCGQDRGMKSGLLITIHQAYTHTWWYILQSGTFVFQMSRFSMKCTCCLLRSSITGYYTQRLAHYHITIYVVCILCVLWTVLYLHRKWGMICFLQSGKTHSTMQCACLDLTFLSGQRDNIFF